MKHHVRILFCTFVLFSLFVYIWQTCTHRSDVTILGSNTEYSRGLTFSKVITLAYKQRDFIHGTEVVYWHHQEYVERRTYRSLKRAWIGFKIAIKDGDHDKLKYYAEGIQKFERQLRLPISDFSDILKGDARNGIGDQTTKQKEDSGTANNEL